MAENTRHNVDNLINRMNTVSISIEQNYTIFYFKYNSKIVECIKTAKDRRYDKDRKLWYVNNKETMTILHALEELGFDCHDAITYAEKNGLILNHDKDISLYMKNGIMKMYLSEKTLSFKNVKNLFSMMPECKYDLKEKTFNFQKNSIKRLGIVLKSYRDTLLRDKKEKQQEITKAASESGQIEMFSGNLINLQGELNELSRKTEELTTLIDAVSSHEEITFIENNALIKITINQIRTKITFLNHHSKLISAVKKIPNRYYIDSEKAWDIPTEMIPYLKAYYEEEIQTKTGEDESILAKAIYEIGTVIKSYFKTDLNIAQGEERLNSIEGKLQGHNIIVSFKYNKEIIDKIKNVEGRKYSKEDKHWIIPKESYNQLIDALKGISNINLDRIYNLKKEIDKLNEKVQLIDISKLKRKPYKHQIEAAEYMLDKKTCIVADVMGLGKSLSAILAAQSIIGKKLIICPSSLKLNWEKEIRIINKVNTITIAHSNRKWVDNIDPNGYVIINYDLLEKYSKQLRKMNFRVCIVDEAHFIKGITNYGKPSTERGRRTLELTEKSEFAFYLTGTPIPNFCIDIFNLLKGARSPLAKDFFEFTKRYCNAIQVGPVWDYTGSSNQDELNKLLNECMIRRKKEDVLDLPEKVRSFIPVSINMKDYKEMVSDYMKERTSLKSRNQHLVYINAMRIMIAKEKAKHTINIANDILSQNKKVVIFTYYSEVAATLMNYYKDRAVKLTGECTEHEGQNAVDTFQEGSAEVFIGTIKAAGVGITLTSADTVIFNDYDWVPDNMQQAEDRINRIGQKNKCTIYYIYAHRTAIDKILTNLLEKKFNNITKILGGKEEKFIDHIIKKIA